MLTQQDYPIRGTPGYAAVQGKEKADTFARKGAPISFTGPESFCGLGDHVYGEVLRKDEANWREALWNHWAEERLASPLQAAAGPGNQG